MMLILFLVCILATLVTVHRAACYRWVLESSHDYNQPYPNLISVLSRSIQDARRNTPLRHLLPIAEDRPPPYMTNMPDSGDMTNIMDSGGMTIKPDLGESTWTQVKVLDRCDGLRWHDTWQTYWSQIAWQISQKIPVSSDAARLMTLFVDLSIIMIIYDYPPHISWRSHWALQLNCSSQASLRDSTALLWGGPLQVHVCTFSSQATLHSVVLEGLSYILQSNWT